jgi:uncharacterized protein (TIGR03000 family)
MSWRSLPLLSAVVLTAAAVLVAAGPAAAAPPGGGGHHGGGGGHSVGTTHTGGVAHTGPVHTGGVAPTGSFRPGGVAVGVHVGGVTHTGSVRPGVAVGIYNRGYGYYPGLYGFGLSTAYYPSYYGGASYYTPSYYDVAPNDYASGQPVGPYRSYYSPMPLDVPPADPSTGAPGDTKAHVRVLVPANAEIWFDGDKTSQTGSVREFVSPPLTPATDFAYEIRARWLENGKVVDQTRTVTVRGGALTVVDFTQPAK